MHNTFSNPKAGLTNVVGLYDFSFDPVGVFGSGSFTNTTITGTSTVAGTWIGSRSAALITFGVTDTSQRQFQSIQAFTFKDVNDYARITFGIRFGTGFHDDTAFFVGMGTLDTTFLGAGALANLPNDFVGLLKEATETTLSMVANDDGGTAGEATVGGVTFAAGVWYDMEIEIRRTGTNEGVITVTVGSDTEYGESYQAPVKGSFTTTRFPDSDAALHFTVAIGGNATDSITVATANPQFAFFKAHV